MPPKRNSKAKPKSKDAAEGSSRAPRGVRTATALLLILAVGGAAGVKYLKTPRGAVFLADHGAVMAYARVQRDASAVLKRALESYGLRRNIRVVKDAAETARHDVDTEARSPVVWDIPCPDSTDLLKVNVVLTEAIQSAGLVVRRSEEFDGGRRLAFHVGTNTLDTHRITLRRVPSRLIAGDVRPPEKLPKLALVIDDFGYSQAGFARELIDLDIPLTITILPTLPFSRDVLEMAKERHRCVLLHLPMQGTGRGKFDVEPITTQMNDAEITALVEGYVESLPGIDGVNNHEGSVATADPRVVKVVMEALKGRDLFFLDSLTSPKSLAYNAAIDAGLRAAQNSMFIDDATERRDDVEARLHGLVELARTRGSAIGIAHPHPWTFEALRDNLEYLKTSGVELVTVCDLIRSTAGAGSSR